MPLFVDLTMFHPDTTVYFLATKNVDRTYAHVFRNLSDNHTDFEFMMTHRGGYGINFSNVKPIRIDNNPYIKVNVPAERIQHCNLMMWKNNDDSVATPIWYYAFIDDVRFINTNCCAILAEVDVFRTYLPYVDIRAAFVERSHIYQGPDEKAGDTIIPEPVSDTIFYEDDIFQKNLFEFDTVTIGYVEKGSEGGQIKSNIFTGIKEEKFSIHNLNSINSFIQQHSAEIIYIVQSPAEYTNQEFKANLPTTVSGITPRNKKLLCYPFVQYLVVSSSGGEISLRPELFENGEIDIHSSAVIANGNYTAMLTPAGYKLSKAYTDMGSAYYNPETTLFYNAGINCAYVNDAWANYWGNNGALKTLSKILTQLGGAVSFNLSGNMSGSNSFHNTTATSLDTGDQASNVLQSGTSGTSSGVSMGLEAGKLIMNLANVAVNFADLKTQVDTIKGSGDVSTDAAFDVGGFYLGWRQIPAEYAESLDYFFDMFGYKTMRLMVVNPKIRPYWCYWKTSTDCFFPAKVTSQTVVGVPASALAIMNSAIKRGVTFWDINSDFASYDDHLEGNHTS